jgi:predicted helicase
LDHFLIADGSRIKWSSSLKIFLERNIEGVFASDDIRFTEYRPFTRQSLYFNELLTHRRARLRNIFPSKISENENLAICCGGYGRKEFSAMAVRTLPDLNFYADPQQTFSFYRYDEDGTNRRENITDRALEQFRSHYSNRSITKWDIFYYTYAVLHHPEYRTRYAANLKRELPRIPYAPDFHGFAKAGKRLAELHVDYEKQTPYPLEQREKPGAKLDLRVEKMRLTKDKQTLVYNDFLTLTGIPKEVYAYRLGNRSALEWVIDQYQVSTDKRSGITNDPNREGDPEYILRLIGQVITVSLETVKIVTLFHRSFA